MSVNALESTSETISKTCSICLSDNHAERYLEGHQREQVFHLFDSSCIRASLDVSSQCPLCRDPLTKDRLIQVYNPHFSWSARGYKWINNVRERFSSRAQLVNLASKVLPLAISVTVGIGTTWNAVTLVNSLDPEVVTGVITGAEATLAAGLVTVISMIFNKITTNRIVNQQTINRIFSSAVVSAVILANSSTVDDSNTAVGIIVGASLTASAAGFVGGLSIFREEGSFQIGPFPNDFTTSDCVLGQVTATAALIIGTFATGKLANHQTRDLGVLMQTISTVSGGALGFASVYLGVAISTFLPIIIMLPRP